MMGEVKIFGNQKYERNNKININDETPLSTALDLINCNSTRTLIIRLLLQSHNGCDFCLIYSENKALFSTFPWL